MKHYRSKADRPAETELREIYTREGSTISSLARHYNATNPSVRHWLESYKIQKKDHKQASTEANNRHRQVAKPSREDLDNLYAGSSIKSLEEYFSVSQKTIYEWLEEYQIPLRSLSESAKYTKVAYYSDIQFSNEILDKEYDRTKPLNVLAEKLGVSRSHVRSLLKKHSIRIEPVEPTYRSKAEIELYEYLVSEFPDELWHHTDRTIIAPLEIDIVCSNKKIAIEYCGLYWHSEGSSGKKQNYHYDKYKRCKEAGYKLITIFESDNMSKVKALLAKLLGRTIKIGARKTIIERLEPNVAANFHKEHHLHSAVGASHHYGLFLDGKCLMVASFGKNRFGKEFQYECTRITSHSNYTVVGGVSKLIKYFISTEKPKSILTFADLRFGDGNVYNKCGFVFIEETNPNYWYSKKYHPKLFSRVKFQKHKLSEMLDIFDPLKTEYENMLDNGWDRIWDCGNAKYIWQ